MESNNDTLGDRIKLILEHENIKNSDLARAINVKDSFISQVIHNKRNLSNRTIQLISKTYRINANWLLYGIGDMYIDKNKYSQQVEKILAIFDTLHPNFQQQAIEYFEFLNKVQNKINESFKEIACKDNNKDNGSE